MVQCRKFTKVLKLESVNMMLGRGVSIAQVAQDLGINQNLISRWIREFRQGEQQAFPGHGLQKPDDAEVTGLQREVIQFKMERDIFKKSRSLLCQGVDVKFGFVAKSRGVWPVQLICNALGVSRGGFMPGCVASLRQADIPKVLFSAFAR